MTDKPCEYCGIRMTDKTGRRQYCSKTCQGHAWRVRNKEKNAAHRAVYKAVRSGRLEKKKCVLCNGSDTIAHHRDYSKWFEVIWLCRNCHKLVHVK